MHSPQIQIIVVFVAAIVMSGCEGYPDLDKNDSKSNFQSPKDGKLSKEQVARYIAIREKIIREVNVQKSSEKKALIKSAEHSTPSAVVRYFDEIEKQVAQSHDMSYDEFLWIKDTVISTQTTMLVQEYYDLNSKIMTLLDKTLSRYEEINADISSRQEQLLMNVYVKEMKQEMINLREKIPDQRNRSEALQHNISIISKFKKELESLEQQALHNFASQD